MLVLTSDHLTYSWWDDRVFHIVRRLQSSGMSSLTRWYRHCWLIKGRIVRRRQTLKHWSRSMTPLSEIQQPTHLISVTFLRLNYFIEQVNVLLPILNINRLVCCSRPAIIEANSKKKSMQCLWHLSGHVARWKKDDLKASSDSLPYLDVLLLHFHTGAELPPLKSPRKLKVWRLLTNEKLFKEDWKLNRQYLSYVRRSKL